MTTARPPVAAGNAHDESPCLYPRFLWYNQCMAKRATNDESSPVRAVAYLRVSTAEQADSGAGLAAQRASVEAEVQRRGWVLVEVYIDAAASGKAIAGREQLARALDGVGSGEAEVMVVAKLDRLSRSLLDFAEIMRRAQSEGWNLVALDLGIDLSTPAGEFLASVMASAAQWERRIIGQRTKEALAAKKAVGVRLGRPRLLPDEVVARISAERAGGRTFTAIADGLSADRVPTAQGGARWYPATVRKVLMSASG
jgi:DNA invertase Pin-like site-specific DNA recombinase